ncbi:MAG: squalene/phytoene synthase family protein, partial [Pirellulales bacterium]|nr:squalene/phytoene synthase family protein [Pirellulales bacterium]
MPGVVTELGLYGPRGVARPATLAEGRAYCRRLACSHYENFIVASLLVPAGLRQHMYNVYAWCRWADDLADEAEPSEALALLDWWQAELAACYEGRVRHPVLVALAETIERFGLERRHFEALLSAFRQDQQVARYETREALLDYCRRSAAPVGRLVLALAGVAEPRCLALADAVCIGLQLLNFWQDVARDWERGRRYLPDETLDQLGGHDAFCRRCATPGFQRALESEV